MSYARAANKGLWGPAKPSKGRAMAGTPGMPATGSVQQSLNIMQEDVDNGYWSFQAVEGDGSTGLGWGQQLYNWLVADGNDADMSNMQDLAQQFWDQGGPGVGGRPLGTPDWTEARYIAMQKILYSRCWAAPNLQYTWELVGEGWPNEYLCSSLYIRTHQFTAHL